MLKSEICADLKNKIFANLIAKRFLSLCRNSTLPKECALESLAHDFGLLPESFVFDSPLSIQFTWTMYARVLCAGDISIR